MDVRTVAQESAKCGSAGARTADSGWRMAAARDEGRPAATARDHARLSLGLDCSRFGPPGSRSVRVLVGPGGPFAPERREPSPVGGRHGNRRGYQHTDHCGMHGRSVAPPNGRR